jgi:hypothetical protein
MSLLLSSIYLSGDLVDIYRYGIGLVLADMRLVHIISRFPGVTVPRHGVHVVGSAPDRLMVGV